ncbi:LGFP repeat-containing protein [Demequina sp. NBRC 110054]|uniref:LGFP repeat-containing protein n=1 Tax=Demequina sp. NBRC 110054 TaxID=1570343 RepID=UPI000A0391B2|nr:hypothetical protein [Demequina sp. NBRC 110054]
MTFPGQCKTYPATRLLAALLATLLSATLVVGVGAQEAEAASSFDAGNIIDDSVFFDSDSMTVTQIQAFLDKKGGDLADYVTSTRYKADDDYCDGYSAKSGQTAAQIIKGVSNSCDISPRVLLVTLQKETSLVTRTNTSAWYYKRAMGYGCPDSNLSTSVDANQDGCYDWAEGFFQQVYHMAKQFQLYAKKPNSYSYKAGESNKIKYNPYCSGYSWVYIENQATAGLYNYTPYQPNDAVLNGTSGSCKAYGNYNFYTLFTSWFGSTHGKSIDANLLDEWRDRGGLDGPGLPTAKAVTTSLGTYQKFQKMYLFVDNDGNGFRMNRNGTLTDAYFASGGPKGDWGFPARDPVKNDGNFRIEFTNLNAYSYDGMVLTSTRVVNWDIVPAWAAVGGTEATGSSVDGAVGSGTTRYQQFENGTVYRKGDDSALLNESGPITVAFLAAGGVDGDWGWPLESPRNRKGIWSAKFDNLIAYNDDGTVDTASRYMNGRIAPAWFALGGSAVVGSPERNPVTHDGTMQQKFDEGDIYVYDDGTYSYLADDSALGVKYAQKGGTTSWWGWPIRASITKDDMARQVFEDANVYLYEDAVLWSKRVVTWKIVPAWASVGGYSVTGGSVDAAVTTSEGTYQEFREGYVFVDDEGDAAFLPTGGPLTKAYEKQGWVDGEWGWPISGSTKIDGVFTVEFTNATVYNDSGVITVEWK